MEQIKMKREVLLEQVRDNREKHVADYKEALKGYRKKRLKAIRKLAKEAEKDPEANFNRIYALRPPMSHEEDYNRVISQLEYDIRAEVELDPFDFDRFVRDEWEWKAQFAASNAQYNSKFRP